MNRTSPIAIGTAGWSIPREVADRFNPLGSSLARYSGVMGCVEVNSSFYRRHRPATWQRWHDSVPADFRFAVKIPKTITHERRLVDAKEDIALLFEDIAPLGDKLGPLLVQLPPSLAFDPSSAGAFLAQLRKHTAGRVVIEPRHVSWASAEARGLLASFAVTQVLADPQLPELRAAVSTSGFAYLRLHGAPRIYYSSYPAEELAAYAALLNAATGGAWCVFDNTASGAALRNALELKQLMAL